MRSVESLLGEYGESHQNRVNKALHWICVPVILWTIIALIAIIPFPGAGQFLGIGINWAVVMLALVLVYYFRLSLTLALGMGVISALMLWLTAWVETNVPYPLWQVAVALFIIAWIGQFIGHAIEGKRPSFFKDLQFLLIGPAWLLSFIYRAIGIKI